MQPMAPTSSPPPPAAPGRRRQYAAGQTQAYYTDPTAGGGAGGYMAPSQQPQQPSQLFTPGLAAENQFQQQQMQATHPPYYGGAQTEPEYINAPQQTGYGQPQQQPPMGALADQFGQMNMGQKGLRLYTANLLTSPPDPRELHNPPPEIVLPPNSCISPNPLANADSSYQRSTINAIPTSNSLLKKANIPFGLVLTPYRSLKEGDEPVPVITDTVIARCRRCRTYINPYVQFIDGGNR
jgi:protein transport protein SEC24